ncbi:MAG: signal peptidase II [Clostridia bacterium]|nr:signal peptidase II [Clostridia bacterium]
MFYWLLMILGSVGLDQLTKWLAVTRLKGEDSFPLWQDVLHFTYVENTGAAFGSFKEHRWVFMFVSTVAIIALIIYYFWGRPHDRLTTVALAFITGGGIGNMIDRVLLGYVVDFIDFTLIDFAVFNIADSFVCVGVGLMFFALFRTAREETRAAQQAEAAESAQEEEPHDD